MRFGTETIVRRLRSDVGSEASGRQPRAPASARAARRARWTLPRQRFSSTFIRPTGLAGQTLRPSQRSTGATLWLTVAPLVEVSQGCRSRRGAAPPCSAGRPIPPSGRVAPHRLNIRSAGLRTAGALREAGQPDRLLDGAL